MNRPCRRGFTLVESLTMAGLLAVALSAAAVAASSTSQPPGRDGGLLRALTAARLSARQVKDSTQVRGIMQSLVMFAQNNAGKYPLPSDLDPENVTVAAKGRAKDTTNHIFSILIFNGFIPPEMCVSPSESNKHIRADRNYAFESPRKAVDPAKALWDPAFRADFTGKNPGNLSYAHTLPAEKRLATWSDTLNAAEAIVGNRGPEISAEGDDEPNSPMRRPRLDASNTFRIHGGPKTWEGNIAYNDGHVNFETRLAPDVLTYRIAAGPDGAVKLRPDNLFFDEKNDADGTNAYLGIWVKAGEKSSDFSGIWD